MTRRTREINMYRAASVLSAVAALAFAAPSATLAGPVRDPGERGGGGPTRDTGRSEPSSPRIDRSPDTPRRDPEPQRAPEAPRRDPEPTRTTDTPRTQPTRDDSPREQPKPAPTPSRDETRDTPRRTDSGGSDRTTPRRDDSGSGDTAPRRENGGSDRATPSRDTSAPRRDGTAQPARDRTAPTRDNNTSGRAPTREASPAPAPFHSRALDVFTRSSEGRRYERGTVLREARPLYRPYLRDYYPWGYCSYPYYSPTLAVGMVYYSPYSYFSVCPAYLYREHCRYAPPVVVWVETPVYVGNECRGYSSRDDDDYYLNRYDSSYRSAPGLQRAVERLEDAFRHGDIDDLAQLTDAHTDIAVYRRGTYSYTLAANDYLDMTRDMMRATDTVRFEITRVRRRRTNAYTASGRHIYEDRDGRRHTVYVSFVLERVGGEWTITQVNSAPERL